MENEHGVVKGSIIWINQKHIQSLIQKNGCILSRIEENGKTFASMPPRPGSGMALNDDDECLLALSISFIQGKLLCFGTKYPVACLLLVKLVKNYSAFL